MKNTLKTDLNEYAKELINAPMVDDSHFCDFHNNIFEGKMSEEFVKMFMEGDGSELISKASAVHSSSMLGYNFFHWISKNEPLTIKFEDKEVKYDSVRYEVKMRVLKRSSQPANMDIVLTNNENNDILFIESKFLEYLNSKKFSISETYQKTDSYYCFGEEWNSLISCYKDKNDKHQYYEGIKQEITHMIALNNWAIGKTEIGELKKYNEYKDVRFINLVFEPCQQDYVEEHNAFSNYKELYDCLRDKLIENGLVPQGMQLSFMSYSDLWPNVKKCISEELMQYLLEHYMKFAYRKP